MSDKAAQTQQQTSTSHPLTSGGILQRKCQSCGQHAIAAGECEDCQTKRRILQRRLNPFVKPTVESTPHPLLKSSLSSDFSRIPAVNELPSISKGNTQPLPEPLTADAGRDPTTSSSLLRDGGQPLGKALMQHFRPSLGSLIDQVRIHSNTQGAQFAARQGAMAVTSGKDIYFARQAYQPHTAAGQNLLAHELAHVHQQHRSNGPPQGYQSRPGDVFEREADRFALTGHLNAWTSDAAMATPHVHQNRTTAEQIAAILRDAVEGLGTDEEAIFNALTGRTPAEIADIKAAYAILSGGETLESRLRDELSRGDLSQALSLLGGETAATETARRLWDAMQGLGTDEEAVYAAVAGRTEEQWTAIKQAYRTMTGESLVAELQDELTSREWQYTQTLLPGAEGGAATEADRATVIANRLEDAVEGLGTDEDAIYAALTGHSDAELREIERQFRLLTGQDLDTRLQDELNDADYARIQQLLHPIPNPERIARRLREAMQGPGTRERAILAILTGRPPSDLMQVRAAYQRIYSESLETRLRTELSGGDLTAVLVLLQAGTLEPEDEIKLAVQGLGTDEERLFAVLQELSTASNPRARIQTTIDSYATKGYGDMLEDIRNDLSGSELNRAIELLHGTTSTTACSSEQRAEALASISVATSMAQNAVNKLDVDIGAGRLSRTVRTALKDHFNPGNAPGAVNIGLASQVRPVLNDTRTDLLTRSQVTCITPTPMPCGVTDPCDPNPSCTRYTAAWTCRPAGSIVRVCSAFFTCSSDQHTTMLHEFVHHIGIDDKFYKHEPGYSSLTPIGDDSANDSLSNADSYAEFAKDVR